MGEALPPLNEAQWHLLTVQMVMLAGAYVCPRDRSSLPLYLCAVIVAIGFWHAS